MKRRFSALVAAAALAAGAFLIHTPPAVQANHSWGKYHWARTSNSFTLMVGDNVHSGWDSYLGVATNDWTKSVVLDLTIVPGGTNPRQCRATSGRIEVCAERYGFNGWLGLAQISVSGDHITQATAKMNDSYFNTASYNTPSWRQLVMCQEIAHGFGLGHQDENFDNGNLGSCMDYARNPAGNEHPNQHDYDQLVTIYGGHTDPTSTVGQVIVTGAGRSGTAQDEGPNDPTDFGRPVGPRDQFGRYDLFVRMQPDGSRLYTHVFWVHPGHSGGQGQP